MLEPVIDHIHLTVTDLDRAESFYGRFLPLLGFDPADKEYDAVEDHDYRIVEYHHPNGFSFGIVNQARLRRGSREPPKAGRAPSSGVPRALPRGGGPPL